MCIYLITNKINKKQSLEHVMNSAKARMGITLKPIKATNLQTGEVLEFKGIKFAIAAGFIKSQIHQCLNGTYTHHRNYKWEYISG